MGQGDEGSARGHASREHLPPERRSQRGTSTPTGREQCQSRPLLTKLGTARRRTLPRAEPADETRHTGTQAHRHTGKTEGNPVRMFLVRLFCAVVTSVLTHTYLARVVDGACNRRGSNHREGRADDDSKHGHHGCVVRGGRVRGRLRIEMKVWERLSHRDM